MKDQEIFLVCQECGHVRGTYRMPEDGEIFCPNCGSIEWHAMTALELEQKEKIDQRLKNPTMTDEEFVNLITDTNMTAIDLSDLLGVSLYTVSCWAHNLNLPHPLIRKTIKRILNENNSR